MEAVKIKSDEIRVNGANLRYEIAGEGETLLFVHAGITDSRMWDEQFETFARTHQVLRYDKRGFGHSSPQEGEFAHRDDLIALLDALDIQRLHGVGNSDGARVLLELTLTQPERVASLTLAAPNVDGYAWQDRHILPYENELNAHLENAEYAEAAEIIAKRWLDGKHRRPSAVTKSLRQKLVGMVTIPLQNRNRYIAEERSLIPSSNSRLAEIKVPVLLIIGDLDLPMFHEMCDRLQEGLPRSRKITMVGTSHLPNMERPEEFNWRLKYFLRRGR